MTGVTALIAADGHVALHLTGESRLQRERLGIAAWIALESLVLAAVPDDRGGVTVSTSARDLASKLGIGKDRAAAALSVLRDAGLLVPVASIAGRSGRFVARRYEIRVPVSRAADSAPSSSSNGRPREVRRVSWDGARLFETDS